MIDDEQKKHLDAAARQSLDVFEAVAGNARRQLGLSTGTSLKALASVNAFTMDGAAKTLGDIDRDQREGHEKLLREPSIARVIAEDENGNRDTFFISRAAAPGPFLEGIKFASYRSPVGRLASLPPGDFIDLQRSSGYVTLEVVERALFHPEELLEGWDSRETLFQTEAFGPVTVESLRNLFEAAAGVEEVEDALGALLKEEQTRTSIVEHRRKSLLDKMGLRDQPVLDKFQDEIFRMPLNSRAVLLGPPGSGKTTTLIKRLGQKLDLEIIRENEPEERALIERMGLINDEPHVTSWLMFTPTELLRAYVKEAFARENIAASDQRIRTWVAHRRDLARDAFSILRKADGGGPFILREDEPTLLPEAIPECIEWFVDFDSWQADRFWSDFVDAAEQLKADPNPIVSALGARLETAVATARVEALPTGLFRLVRLIDDVRASLDTSRTRSDSSLRKALNLQINGNKNFLKELAGYIDQLGESANDEADDDEGDIEEDETPKPQQPIMRTANAYLSTLRSQARATASGRKPRGRPANILNWLGDRSLPEADLLPVGRELILQRALLRFSNPVRQFLRGIPRRYRAFRQIRRDEGRWYQPERAGNHINGLEVDLMLLASLRLTSRMMQDNQRRTLTDNPGLAVLDRTTGIQRNQILVDEATDFSPVQLACMAALANPEANSFFACGDFNQRITSWGTSNVDQLKWVYPDIELKEIAIAYRQTRQLLDFARAIAEATGEQPVLAKLPDDVDNEGVAPVLATGISEEAEIVQWLADRIVEIEATVSPRPLPTIAILVNGEHQVRPVAEALDQKLEAHNLRAVACTDGRIIGQTNEIRVFDVQHIKGLEFEAVFFLGIDVLASHHPLFARFLYVGATRAATYLGITCEGDLPTEIAGLENLFAENW